jgi:very-short-patch-repair endonuclease
VTARREPPPLRTDQLIARFAGPQSGAVSHEQLRSVGITDREIRTRIVREILHRHYLGVYAYGNPNLDARGELIAAILAAGAKAFISHHTAAGVRGLTSLVIDRIELTLPGENRVRLPGLIVHRTGVTPHADDVTRVDGMRVSSVPRILVELARTSSERELEDLITMAVRLKQFDLTAVEAILARHPHRRGLAKLKRALRHYRDYANSKSKLERAFDRWLARHPEIPPPLKNVYIDGWEIDRYWPQFQLAVELDGRPWHLAIQDRDRDNRKDTALQLLGIRPMRIDDTRWEHSKAGILEDLHAFMGLRAA